MKQDEAQQLADDLDTLDARTPWTWKCGDDGRSFYKTDDAPVSMSFFEGTYSWDVGKSVSAPSGRADTLDKAIDAMLDAYREQLREKRDDIQCKLEEVSDEAPVQVDIADAPTDRSVRVLGYHLPMHDMSMTAPIDDTPNIVLELRSFDVDIQTVDGGGE